ncbi:MAG: ABC transporter ATP-binding protein [Deltaproteobacteria bacterium]|nr:ABC transporter ATP-binding protein [Deltaproteobacteria bacterium]MCL5277237.1 ABC transporter ATP-binding protein [Deltaproteobacteria bacterium]
MALLQVNDLKVSYKSSGFFRKQSEVRAVDGVSLHIDEHETLGLVGESGSGKSTLGRTILLLVEPSGGSIFFDGIDLLHTDGRTLRRFRRQVQIVFQDPYSSLNPRMKTGNIIADPMRVHRSADRRAIRERVLDLLDLVGLPASAYDKYPYAFSGGQRQRISIARALSISPRFIVADEPVSALDISIQAQLLNLLKEIQEKQGVSYLFISHDLRTVAFIAHRIAVMYLGRIVELASRKELIAGPLHPYTQLLLSSIPSKQRRVPQQYGEPSAYIRGCRFYPRCRSAMDRCRDQEPRMKEVSPGHEVACYLY